MARGNAPGAAARPAAAACPYLDTVDRKRLNFDFDKVCSVTLEKQNVFACLVCGKYLQGKSHGTPAETHAVQAGHFVFMSLDDGRVFCLPDNYEVRDSSLDDIKYNLHPRFTEAEIQTLDSVVVSKADTYGTRYLRGVSPMNDIGRADYINATVQILSRVRPLRDYFLQEENYRASRSAVVHAFGTLVCKLWSSRKLKASVSAHEFLHAVAWASKKRFDVDRQADAADFLKWLLHELHMGLGGSHKPGSSIIHKCFQGEVMVETEVLASAKAVSVMMEDFERAKDEGGAPLANGGRGGHPAITSKTLPALMLSLELPASPLFKEGREGKSLIPEIDIREALRKFDGKQFFDAVVDGKIHRRRYRLVRLPPYLLLHVNRFSKTKFSVEKNATIVDLCIHSLDMGSYVLKDSAAEPQPRKRKRKRVEHPDFATTVASLAQATSTKYNLVGSLCHQSADASAFAETSGSSSSTSGSAIAGQAGRPGYEAAPAVQNATYLAHVYSKPDSQWYELKDLRVQPTDPDLVARAESYFALYENLSSQGAEPAAQVPAIKPEPKPV